MKEKKKDPLLASVLAVFALLIAVGLVLAFLSLISPVTFIFVAIMLLICLGPIAEMRGAY